MPPTSPLCSSGTEETVTAPSCDASMPMPSPARSIGQVTISGPAPASSAATNTTSADEQHEEPELRDPARRRVREHLGDPDRGDHQSDRQRQDPQAGVDGREPERDRQEQRHREEQAGLEQVLEEERDGPTPQERDPQDRRIEQRRLARVAPVLLPLDEPEQHHATTEQQPDHRRQSPTRSAGPASVARTPSYPNAGCRRRSVRARARRAPSRPGRGAHPPPSACRPCAGSGAAPRR